MIQAFPRKSVTGGADSHAVRRPSLLSLLVVLGMLPTGPCPAGTLYKWTDETGKVHYSDRIPPRHIGQGHQEIDARGIVVREVDAAQDPREREAEQHRRREQAHKEAQARRRRIRDQVLLETYRDTAQLIAARDRHIGTLDAAIRIARTRIENLERQRRNLARRAAGHERAGEAVPGDLRREIDDIDRQIIRQTAFIEAREADRAALLRSYAEDIERFERLTSGQVPASSRDRSGPADGRQDTLNAGSGSPRPHR